MGKLYRILAVFLEKGDYSTVLYMAFVSQLHTDSLVTRHWSLVTDHCSLNKTPELVRGFSYQRAAGSPDPRLFNQYHAPGKLISPTV